MLTITSWTGEIGNGRATAIVLARQGAKVALIDYNLEWAQETKHMIDEEGGISDVIQADVTDEDSCRVAVEKTVQLFGALHILINIGMLHHVLPTRGLRISSELTQRRSRRRRYHGRCYHTRSGCMGKRHADKSDQYGVDGSTRYSRDA